MLSWKVFYTPSMQPLINLLHLPFANMWLKVASPQILLKPPYYYPIFLANLSAQYAVSLNRRLLYDVSLALCSRILHCYENSKHVSQNPNGATSLPYTIFIFPKKNFIMLCGLLYQ